MIWWAKARQITALSVALITYLLLLAVVGGKKVPLPGISVTSNVVLTAFLAILPPVALLYSLRSRALAPEMSGVRKVFLMDAGLATAAVLCATIIGLIAYTINGDEISATAGRNAAFLIGLTLFVHALIGQAAVLATVLWPVCVGLFGFHGADIPYHWTILPERAGAWWASLGAALTLACGLAAQLLTARRQPS